MADPTLGRQLLYLCEQDVVALAPSASDIADAIEEAVRARADGRMTVYPKAVMNAPGTATFFAMPAVVRGGLAGVKWLGGEAGNPARGLPAYMGLTTLSDAATGVPVAIVAAAALTTLRTAALSLLAARYLAPPASSVLGLIGAGAQAASHLAAFRAAYPFQRVLVASPGDTAERFCATWGSDALPIERADADAVLEASDIVLSTVAAIGALTPYLDARRLRRDAFVSMVDLGRPWTVEGLAAFDAVYTDDIVSSTARGASVEQMRALTYAGDLTDLASGPAADRAPRTAFLFAGTPLADIAAAILVYQRAVGAGAGQVLAL